MKKLSSVMAALTVVALAAGGGLLSGCKHGDGHEHGSGRVDQYTCPHHPEVVQSTAGKCPKCGMKLEHKH